jgi:hypothetical protein
MRGRIRRLAWAIGVASLAAVAAIAIASISNAAPSSLPLHGHMRDIHNFFAPACTSVTGICSSFNATGSINGDGVVQIETPPDADGISKAHTVIHTAKGDLACREAAVFDVRPPLVGEKAFVDLCLIDGATSTGMYAGASGYIQEVGIFDFKAPPEVSVGELEYYGKLILGG